MDAGSTSFDDATRAKAFFDWVRNIWNTPGDNVFSWDFFALETAGDVPPYMNDAYVGASSPAHPSSAFSATVAPCLGQRIVDVIEGRGDSESITGH